MKKEVAIMPKKLQEVLGEYMRDLTLIRALKEGMEWTDGWYNYIAYNKADGTVAVRDAEGFDYTAAQWVETWMDEPEKTTLVEDDLTPEERIARWLAAGGSLDRDGDGRWKAPQEECPEHGLQDVKHTSSSKGSDPYAVIHLACGHRVSCFGPGEDNVIV